MATIFAFPCVKKRMPGVAALIPCHSPPLSPFLIMLLLLHMLHYGDVPVTLSWPLLGMPSGKETCTWVSYFTPSSCWLWIPWRLKGKEQHPPCRCIVTHAIVATACTVPQRCESGLAPVWAWAGDRRCCMGAINPRATLCNLVFDCGMRNRGMEKCGMGNGKDKALTPSTTLWILFPSPAAWVIPEIDYTNR